ncbi:anti-sigma B factor antagonist [Sodalis-like endosymbiont of Proechinophthirus fluctus]|uniref:lipid asymmetry maintenance protein MlaB n=1 Tax=Sodalis-like endosymbiont of Proechinophthirus fluctus TaxID=1462730 RepID=UPI0007A80587|nr:lipid asymmetry maintenance protein MlaB [Sodalis-like endosymbiont of Proechinophthirus fluctus]KYP97572.1 anti-sigma B factor antagonist [Sodalis-like endosymbiont of Proechinophthirus fluctus]
MADELSWRTQGQTLILQGELDRDTLPTLWQHRQVLLDGIRFLDVSGLKRVDSAGVALMLHFYHQQNRGDELVLTGVTDRLRTLIALYRLQAILPCDPPESV